jgi:hypothetical protein
MSTMPTPEGPLVWLKFRHVAACTALLVTLTVLGCDDDSPTRPSQPLPPLPAPPVSLARVDIGAPVSIEPQRSAQLAATAVRSDGTTEDVTSQAQWSSSNSATVRISATGEATALRAGEVTITARYQSRTGTVSVLGLPAGTHKLTGVVSEEGRTIDGVSVSIVSGVGSGLTTTTSGGGRFSFYGTAGRVTLQAKRNGYQNVLADVDVTATPTTRNLEIVPARPRLDLSGNYTLTITAHCDVGVFKIPAPANKRTFDATVQQQGPDLALTVSGANLITSNEGRTRFDGSVDVLDNVGFGLGSFDVYYYYYVPFNVTGLVEQISSGMTILIAGNVGARASSSSIVGNLSGAFMLREGNTQFPGYCLSGFHPFEMRRR